MLKINLLLLVAAISCRGEEESLQRKSYKNVNSFNDAVDRASLNMLKEAYETAEDKNVITSPLGIFLLLSEYSAGAGVGSREEIIKTLGSSNYDELLESYSNLSKKFSEMDPSYLTLANKIFVSDKSELNETFVDTIINSYQSEIERVNFMNPPAVVDAINNWAAAKTKGHIKKPVSEKIVKKGDVAALVNVIFFLGNWKNPFYAKNTRENDFHVGGSNKVKKQMMRSEYSLLYGEISDLRAKLVELPYKEKGFRMVIILPDEVDGLPTLLKKVAERGILTAINSLTDNYEQVILDMPKFEIQSTLDLNVILPKVGVSKIFHEPAPGITKGPTVVVSKAFQKAFIKVDENGSTAGAFTDAEIIYTAVQNPKEFKADHPFLFVILQEDVVVFASTYTH